MAWSFRIVCLWIHNCLRTGKEGEKSLSYYKFALYLYCIYLFSILLYYILSLAKVNVTMGRESRTGCASDCLQVKSDHILKPAVLLSITFVNGGETALPLLPATHFQPHYLIP